MNKQHIFLMIVLVAFMISACNTHMERPPNDEQLITQGQQLYVEYCSECHQTDGNGWSTLYPNLAGNPIVTLHDAEPLIVTVKYGQGSMPAFGQRLNIWEIAAILSYIRNSWGNKAPAISWRQIN